MSRTAIVTGAASGIGLLTVERLVAREWRVAAVDLPGEPLKALARRDGVSTHACDVSRPDEVDRVAAAVEERYGRVDRLVNAAGIAVSGSVQDVSNERFARVIEVNYLGTVHWVRAVLPQMRRRGAGELVLFASLAGWFATPRMGAYTASKFAVVGLAETLKLELAGSGIALRCVCPPAVRTPMLDDIFDQGMSRRATKLAVPIAPETVLDAVDAALARPRGKVFVFPGRGSTVMWRMRRFLPGLFDAIVRRTV
ncbi:SDR family NAD(P)-dependent oxidoreductase [Nocardia sp. CA-135953]|uniref:SDR family NAD(P)-dependent oxidoreductase n=1 Tax=Nocardia sp. CA-135953 TaxID=3239978 RepID=UPI003D96F859